MDCINGTCYDDEVKIPFSYPNPPTHFWGEKIELSVSPTTFKLIALAPIIPGICFRMHLELIYQR